jgi:hypothetical protein
MLIGVLKQLFGFRGNPVALRHKASYQQGFKPETHQLIRTIGRGNQLREWQG